MGDVVSRVWVHGPLAPVPDRRRAPVQDAVVIPDERPSPLPRRAAFAELHTARLPVITPAMLGGNPLFEADPDAQAERRHHLREETADADGCPGRARASVGAPTVGAPTNARADRVEDPLRPTLAWFEPPVPVDLPAPVATPDAAALFEAAQLLTYAGRFDVAAWVEGWATASVRPAAATAPGRG